MLRTLSMMLVLLVATVALAGSEAEWKKSPVKWEPYEAGLARAKKESKPLCLIFYTDWCPHCTNYAKVFQDPKVVEKSKSFVMVLVNRDQDKALSAKFAPDGEYIPRTYFLSAAGELDPSLSAPRDKFKYFYDESRPEGIIEGMDRALGKLAKKR